MVQRMTGYIKRHTISNSDAFPILLFYQKGPNNFELYKPTSLKIMPGPVSKVESARSAGDAVCRRKVIVVGAIERPTEEANTTSSLKALK